VLPVCDAALDAVATVASGRKFDLLDIDA